MNFFKKSMIYTTVFWLSCLMVSVLTLSSCVWLCLVLWFHRPLGEFVSFVAISTLILSALIFLAFFGAKLPYAKFLGIYLTGFLAGVLWFVNLAPSADKEWQDDVARVFSYSQTGDIITVHSVRNFAWRTEQNYDTRWDRRSYDLSQLVSADLVISDWGIEPIVHTMVSFGFADGNYLTFSIETRKEKTEKYSALGGFFRKYELLFVAGDEKDLIYTRSNVRGEQVYLYPITANRQDLQRLFLAYLAAGQDLQTKPKWYHTLFSNCTTVIYQLIDTIAPNQLPKDYRILLAGELPSYLLEHQLLDNRYSKDEWKKIAHINPKVAQMNIGTPSTTFSQAIRMTDKK